LPADFYQGFFANDEGAWHEEGTVVRDYPGRDEAQVLAGHDFEAVEFPIYGEMPAFEPIEGIETPMLMQPMQDFKGVLERRPGQPDKPLSVVSHDRPTVQPDEVWDLVDLIVGQPNMKYETAGRLGKHGEELWVLAWLDEPVYIKGDNSPILMYLCVSTGYATGKGLTGRSTSYRVVCRNTLSGSEAEGKRSGTDFTLKHTKNMRERIDQIKERVKGERVEFGHLTEVLGHLADVKVTGEQRELFVCQFVPKPPEYEISNTVARNVDEARAAVRAILDGPTVPDAHRFTAYGLRLAADEYLDHYRLARTAASKFGRSFLRDEGAKKRAANLIQKMVAA